MDQQDTSSADLTGQQQTELATTEPLANEAAAATERHQTGSAAATERLGGELAGRLRGGDVVLLIGELGAGKTTFVRGAARALGVAQTVSSPTFTIGQRYAAAGGAVATVSHLDLYRLRSLDGEDPDLLADYVGADTITFVEWPQAAAGAEAELSALAGRVLSVTLAHRGGDRREVRIG